MKIGTLLAYLLAAFMAFMGLQKFIGDVPIFLEIERNLANDHGFDLAFIDPGLKIFTGVAELAAAAIIILLNRFFGSLVSVAIIGGAILAHLTVLGINTPVSSDPADGESPVLFFMAVGSFILAAAATWLNKPKGFASPQTA